MGNSLDSSAASKNDSDDRSISISSLNSSELQALKTVFQKISSDGVVNCVKLKEYFLCEVVPDFGEKFYSVLVNRGALDERGFLAVIASCSRGTPTATVALFWDISQKQLPEEKIAPTLCFFYLVLEFGNCVISGITETATVLADNLKNSIKARGGVFPSEDAASNFKAMMDWSNEFAPSLPRLLVTYLNRVCFPYVELLSFSSFCPPVLETDSSITTQSRLLPLALYSTSLQGRWKRLYTTERDGISFNRIAHNILGYGVSESEFCHLILLFLYLPNFLFFIEILLK